MNTFELKDGDTITGYDFGRNHNHIIACRITVDSTHEPDGYRILDWGTIDFGDATLEAVISKLAHTDISLFDSAWHLLERQVPQNGRFASNTFCYALSHGLQAVLETRRDIAGRVAFVSAQSKFAQLDPHRKHCPDTHTTDTESVRRKLNYGTRKQWAVNLCKHHVRYQDREQCLLFDAWKKRDDLADAFLYAYAFFRKHTRSVSTTETDSDRRTGSPRNPVVVAP